MLQLLPEFARLPVLIALGALIGGGINWAIYRLALIRKRQISPWQTGPLFRTAAWHRIPILGWLNHRHQLASQGRGLWIRPWLLEIAWAIGLPWFWYWQLAGGLTGGVPAPSGWAEIWFWGHTALFALLTVATFIDFDEKTIPDSVTVPGVLLALTLAAAAPSFRLPVVTDGLAGTTVGSLQYMSPDELTNGHRSMFGLGLMIAVWIVWILALLPKLVPYDGPVLDRLRFMIASVIRPARAASACPLGNTRRGPRPLTWRLLGVGLVGGLILPILWFWLSATQQDSLFGAIVGLAFGGGLVWAIRIIAGMALQQEAMGFGDVTLMAMIGAFLGWQSTLLAFGLAPFAGMAIALATLLIRGENKLAFGPYLCLGAVVNVLGWAWIWPLAAQNLFSMGGLFLAGTLLGSALLMYPLLLIVRGIKDWLLPAGGA